MQKGVFISVIFIFYTLIIFGQEKPKMNRFLSISPTSVQFGAEGGTKTFTVNSSGSWSISSNTQSWGHLNKSGNTLTLRVDENTRTSSRSDSFELMSGEKRVRVSIVQNGGILLSVSSENLSFSPSGGTKTISVTTNGLWEIGTGIASWGHLTKSGNQLIIKIDPNTSTSSRTDWCSIKAGNKEKRINISQSGNSSSLSISKENLNFDSSGGTQTITITTNGIWEIGANTASWGHLTKSGNQLSIKIDKNIGTSPRTDWFTIKAGNNEKRVNITQSGTPSGPTAQVESITVDHNQNLDDGKGMIIHVKVNVQNMKEKNGRVTAYFYDTEGNALIDTNGRYSTSGNPSHVATGIDITPRYDNSSYSDLRLTIPYSELHQTGSATRNLKFKIVIWDKSVSPNNGFYNESSWTTFSFTPGTNLTVNGTTSDKTKYFSESGGRERYTVDTSDSNYETWGVPSWCSIENKTSTGFTLVCERNTSQSSRSDYMKVKAAGQEIRIDITQEACSGPSATITSVEQEHNVFNGYVKGMRIKLKFDVSGMQYRTIKATAWFYYGDNTTQLNSRYGGQVHVSNSDTAPYENTTFTMTLFMPYQSLNMAPGFNGYLSFDVVISDSSGNKLARQNNNSFTYSQGW